MDSANLKKQGGEGGIKRKSYLLSPLTCHLRKPFKSAQVGIPKKVFNLELSSELLVTLPP